MQLSEVARAGENPTDRPAGNTFSAFSWSRLMQFGSSFADQALAVAGMFLANIALARAQSKEEYGMFALWYSIYTFLAGVHNAVILEPYTIHGAGRYHDRFAQYGQLMSRNNSLLGVVLAIGLLSIWTVLKLSGSSFASLSLLGLSIAIPVLLAALFVRRTFYLRNRPDLAARLSIASFSALLVFLVSSMFKGWLNGFSVFVIAAASWIAGGLLLRRELPAFAGSAKCQELSPGHWSEHWKYARWVLATALVFQLTTQGYYWLLAGSLSVKDVADLRAMHILVGPVDQVCVALDLLILPLMAYRYAAQQDSALVSLWKKFGVLTLGVTLAYALIIWSCAAPLMHALYAGKFDDLAPLLGILAFLPVVMGLGNGFNVALKSMERPDWVLHAYVAGGASTFIVGVPFVRHFGLRGAVYGMLSSGGVYALTMGLGLLFAVRSELDKGRLLSLEN
jgi:O-antigen/teichoic acid export membrane protein